MKRKIGNFITVAAVALICLLLLPTEAKAASVEDLTFTLNSDSVSYSVTNCDTFASGELVIPAAYNGLPVTSIGYGAFESSPNLTSITIPDGVTYIGHNAFKDCPSLTSITIPDGVTYIGHYAFRSCYSLTSITIPDSVTSFGDYTFSYCYSLTSITIPDGVTSIGDYTFERCTGLTSITIPDSVTSIGCYVFQSCTSLSYITIPDTVTFINYCAFNGCTILTDVYYTGTQEQWDAITIASYNNEYLLNATLHLVDACTDGHSFDESGKCACGAVRATVTVADDKVIVNTNDLSNVKVHAFNITDKDVADINVWNELQAADPSFKTYTKSSFTLKNGTYVLRVQYNTAEGVVQADSYKVIIDYTPAAVAVPEIVVVNNAVSINDNGITGVKVHAFNITDKAVSDINVWNELQAADPSFKTYTESSFTLKNGTYVLRTQYKDDEGVTHTESHKVIINYESVVPQAIVSGKTVTLDAMGANISKVHIFYVESAEINDINSWNELQAADPSFKSYTKSQFSVKHSGTYVLRIEYVDQNGIAQRASQMVITQ